MSVAEEVPIHTLQKVMGTEEINIVCCADDIALPADTEDGSFTETSLQVSSQLLEIRYENINS